MSLDHLVGNNARERDVKAKAEAALKAGKITKTEYEYFVGKELGSSAQILDATTAYAITETHDEHKRKTAAKVVATIVLLGILFVSLWAFTQTGGFTGFVTYDATRDVTTPVSITLTESSTIPLDVTGTTKVAITGTLADGTADVWLVKGEERFLVYHGSAATPAISLWTPFTSYARDEALGAVVTPESASYTLWLTDEKGEKTLIDEHYATSKAGDYTLDALVNDSGTIEKVSVSFTVRNDNEPADDVAREQNTRVPFTEACGEACSITDTGDAPLALDIELTEGATLTIARITTTTGRENTPPEQIAAIPDVEMREGESTTIDLAPYFIDADEDELIYDFMNAPGLTMSVTGSSLTITANSPGVKKTRLYVTDGFSLIESSEFNVRVTPATIPDENETGTNGTGTGTNTSMNDTGTGTGTNTTVNASVGNLSVNGTEQSTVPQGLCSHPDPNKRPIECLQEDPASYFQAQALYVTDANRVPIARLTPIGNLLIRGDVVENAAFAANTDHYTIGYMDAYGNYVVTIWFDSATGNVYLKGRLYEENENNVPAPGAFALRNKRGITLAWADKTQGDLYVRGNVITNRDSIE